MAGKSAQQRMPGEHEHRIGHRNVDVAAVSAHVALAQAQQDIENRRKRAAPDIRNKRRWNSWTIVRARIERQQAGSADIVEIVPCFLGARTGLAIAGNRSVDDTRIDGADTLIPQTEPVHDTGPKLLDQDVGARQQRRETFAIAFGFEIER